MADSRSDDKDISVIITTGIVKVHTADSQVVSANSLSSVCTSFPNLKPSIEDAIKRGLGGERDDQEIHDFKPETLEASLCCKTGDRFLQVLEDHESGELNKCLKEELSKVDVVVEELKIKIQDMEKVKNTKCTIINRYATKIYIVLTRKYNTLQDPSPLFIG